MNINPSNRNYRFIGSRNLEKHIIDDIKKDVIKDVQADSQNLKSPEVVYGRASSQQYLANMGIKIVNSKGAKSQQVNAPSVESRSAAAPQTASASAQVSGGSGNVPADLYATAGSLVEEIARLKAQEAAIPAEFMSGLNKLGELAQDTEAYQKAIGDFADKWLVDNNVEQITEKNVGKVLSDFYSQEFGLNLANLAKCVGCAAIASLAIKVGVSTVIDVAPDLCKDTFNWTKDIFKDVFSGDVLGLIEDVVIDAPVMLVRNTGRVFRSLAENTYETARDVVVAAGEGAYDVAKTAVKGSVKTVAKPVEGVWSAVKNVGGGIVSSAKKLVKGNVIGAVGSVVGGVTKAVGNVISGVVGGAANAAKTIVKTAGKAVKAVGKVAETVFGNPIKAVGSAIKSVGKAIGKIFKGW